MISDFVKGKSQYEYERQVQAGIRLHREIDSFTDDHPATAAAKQIFRPHYRLYSGAIMDVVYDHFLANDKRCFSDSEELFHFSKDVYHSLEAQAASLPPRFLQVLPYMKQHNWLYHYKDKEGIAKSLQGLVRRAAYLSDAEAAIHLFEEHYSFLQLHASAFIGDVKSFAKERMEQLLL